ncbi:MAG: DUF4388 domain-containing protein [Nitrospirae bacterium]|nr:DUF4388 domain-containing protein [Nitrospirota bacterium]
MALTGSLVDFSVSDILQLIRLQRKGGALRMHTHRRRVCIWFAAGNVVMAERSDLPLAEVVGRALVADGRLPEQAFQRVVSKARREPVDVVLGETLAAATVVLVEAYVRATVLSLFAWNDGEYTFDVDAPPPDHLAHPFAPIDTDLLLMDCASEGADWPEQKEHVGGLDTVFVRGEPAGALPERDARILAMVDGRRDVQAIADAGPDGLFQVCAALAGLAERGMIRARVAGAGRGADRAGARRGRARPDRRRLAAASVAALCVGLVGLCGWLFLATPKGGGGAGAGFLEATWSYRDHKVRQALDLYRMVHGRYPDSLARLTDAGLVSGARPFAEMRYSRDGDGYSLHADRGGV